MSTFRYIPSPEDAAPLSPPEHLAAMKRWTREILQLGDDVVISVHEAHCVDPGCPLLVTHIVVHDDEGHTWCFERPKSTVTKLMLQQVLRPGPKPSSGV